MKDKNHIIMSVYTEKKFDKIPFHNKNTQKLKQNYFNKITHENHTAKFILHISTTIMNRARMPTLSTSVQQVTEVLASASGPEQ